MQNSSIKIYYSVYKKRTPLMPPLKFEKRLTKKHLGIFKPVIRYFKFERTIFPSLIHCKTIFLVSSSTYFQPYCWPTDGSKYDSQLKSRA